MKQKKSKGKIKIKVKGRDEEESILDQLQIRKYNNNVGQNITLIQRALTSTGYSKDEVETSN